MKTLLTTTTALMFTASAAFAGSVSGIINADTLNSENAKHYTATQSIGKDVLGKNMEKIATVEDMLISMDGEVTHIVLDVDDITSATEPDVAVPYDQFGWNESKDALTLNATKEALNLEDLEEAAEAELEEVEEKIEAKLESN